MHSHARARLRQAVAEADAHAHPGRGLEQGTGAVARADEHEPEFGIEEPALDQNAQQQRHGRQRRGLEEHAVVRVVPRPPAEGDGGAAAQAPQKPAHEAEHMAQRQQAQQRVLRRERQLCRTVPRALAQAVIREDDGLGALRRAGGEEQDLSFSVLHAGHEGERELFFQVLVAPEGVDVGVADEGL